MPISRLAEILKISVISFRLRTTCIKKSIAIEAESSVIYKLCAMMNIIIIIIVITAVIVITV